MQRALQAYVSTLDGGSSHRDAVLAAADAVRADPVAVVECAGLLARCRPAVAGVATGLTSALRRVPMGSRAAILTVAAGQRYPVLAQSRRYRRGVHDAPVDMARRVVEQALAASDGRVGVGIDLACGPGAFLLAMHEAGVKEIFGTDLDPLVLEVAARACPRARLLQEDPTRHGPPADLVVGTPPFVSHDQVDESRRADLRRRFPWLGGAVDFVAGFAATAIERVRAGGGIGLVLPSEDLVRPLGSTWRRRVVERHQVLALAGPMPFPGSQVEVTILVAQSGAGPSLLPDFGLQATEALQEANVLLDAQRRPGDAEALARIDGHSTPLSALARVEAGIGLVAPGSRVPPDLLLDHPGLDRVPFAEARSFFAGEHRWLHYKPSRLQRATDRALHEGPKVVVRRARMRAPLRAAIDRDGVFVGSSCTVVAPTDPRLDVEQLHQLLSSPLLDGWLRVKLGRVTDLTPAVLKHVPVPNAWLNGEHTELDVAWGIGADVAQRLWGRAVR